MIHELGREYPLLRKALTKLLYRLGRPIAERLIATVIYSALDWDVPPSDIDNLVDRYLEEQYLEHMGR